MTSKQTTEDANANAEKVNLTGVSEVAKMPMSNRRIKINLMLVSLCFLLNFSAYMCMEGLQSSLNSDAGAHSLSAIYATFVVTSLFLPTLAMEFLNSRKSMVVATLPYALYTLANCYPRTYTLIPSALLVGSAASVLWAANRVYVCDLAFAYAKQNSKDVDKTTSYFYGIFWAVFALCMLIGNLVSSIVFTVYGVQDDTSGALENAENATYLTTATYQPPTESPQQTLRCAMHNCDAPENMTDTSSATVTANLNPVVLYALFGAFAAIQIGSSLLLLFLGEDAPDRQSFDTQTNEMGSDEGVPVPGSKDDHPTSKHNGEETEFTSDDKVIQEKQGWKGRVAKQSLATGKLLVFNHSAQLLILHTIHIGLFQGYIFGQLTRHWVTCVLGIQFVGYVSSTVGLSSTLGAYAVGWLTQRIGRWIVVVVTCLIELALTSCLLIWEPEIVSDMWLFFVVFGVAGIVHATYKTVHATIYSIFFPNDKEAASACLSLWDAMGAAIAYAISSDICNVAFTIFLMVLVTVGTLLYLITERMYAIEQKRQKKREDDEKKSANME